MWCIGKLTAEFRERMDEIIEVYQQPYEAAEPVVCLDEKSKQLREQTRRPIAGQPGEVAKEDYEYNTRQPTATFELSPPITQSRAMMRPSAKTCSKKMEADAPNSH